MYDGDEREGMSIFLQLNIPSIQFGWPGVKWSSLLDADWTFESQKYCLQMSAERLAQDGRTRNERPLPLVVPSPLLDVA